MVLFAHCCLANVAHTNDSTGITHNGAFYEYDTTKNGWYIGSPTSPIMVNLRRHHYQGIPDRYYDFANRTFARQPSGVCTKEIP